MVIFYKENTMGLISGIKSAVDTVFVKPMSLLVGKLGKRSVSNEVKQEGTSGIKTKEDAKGAVRADAHTSPPKEKPISERKADAPTIGAGRTGPTRAHIDFINLTDKSKDYLIDKFNLLNKFQTGVEIASDDKTIEKMDKWIDNYINGEGRGDPNVQVDETKRDTMFKID